MKGDEQTDRGRPDNHKGPILDMWVTGRWLSTGKALIFLKTRSISATALSSAFKVQSWGFPGGAVVKNPPANAGDTGSSPGPGRSHMLWSN